MHQHNYWKMKQTFNFLIQPVLWVFGCLLFFLNVVIKSKLTIGIISTLITIITLVLGVLWKRFEKKWWKNENFQKIFSEDFKTPVVEGRWKGKLIRDNEQHDFVIEIKQTFTTISCATFSKHSTSKSTFAEILYDGAQGSYQVIYSWKGQTENTRNEDLRTNSFDGFTILDVRNNRLEGEYFTNRQPSQTQGKIILDSRQKELKNSYYD